MRSIEYDPDQLVTDAFRRASWRVQRPSDAGKLRRDLTVEGGGSKYLVEIKRSSEGRRDRVIPLLSQAILEAQALAKEVRESPIPVAVVAAPRVSPAVVDAVEKFLKRMAPDAGAGIVDADGLRAFWGHGLEVLNARPSEEKRRSRNRTVGKRSPRLFSDLNQWMLKILLAKEIPAQLLSAPRAPLRNASELANAAKVSVMSASRLIRRLEKDGFIDTDEELLKLARIPELLSRWQSWREPIQEFPARWLVKRDRAAFATLLQSYSATLPLERSSRKRGNPPRTCLGLFAAADALGLGFVHGVQPHIYMERFDPEALKTLGLSTQDAEHNPDAFVRIPANPEAVFRAAVLKDGVPCADVLQVWLDVADHPSRGKAQADEIARRVLGPLLRNM